jgi:hypothetical protein
MIKRMTLALIGSLLAACSSEPETTPTPKSRGEVAGIKISATVESVDVGGRKITLKGPSGEPEIYTVGEEVKRLAEIKVGDTITLDYKVAAVAELRQPTEEEKKTPLLLAQGSERAPASQPPGGAFARAVRAVAFVEAVDSKQMNFTIRGPKGGMIKIPVSDPAKLDQVKIWQAVVVTFIETALITVEPQK